MSQVENMQNPPHSHDKVLTWMRLWGCRPCCHSTEVIGICIRHDAPAPQPRRLNKHLEIICVHLGLLFCSTGPAVALRYPVLVGQLSTAPSQANGIHCSNQSINQPDAFCLWKDLKAAGPFQGLYQRKRLENILITQHSGSFHVAAPARASLFFLLSLICLRHPSLGAGRHSLHQAWVNISQVNAWICIPPIVSHHIQAHVHTHTHISPCTITHRDVTASNLPLC